MQKDLFIAHVFNDYSGSPRVLRDAIEACNDVTGDCYLFTSRHSGFLDGASVTLVPIFYHRSKFKLLQLFYYLLSQLHLFGALSYFLLRSIFKRRKRTLLVNTLLPFGAGIAGKLFASTVVYYVHESHISPALLKKFLRVIVNFVADYVIFVSKYLAHAESFTKPKQIVIYNGLRSDFPNDPKINEKVKFNSKQVFFAGSLKNYKGVEQLRLLAKNLNEFKFLAALNCNYEELLEYKNKNEIPENLILLARPENIQECFANSFCVINLSLPEQWVETFGLSLIEGMIFGCPAIAPPVGGPIEFVNPMNGLLSDSRDIDRISSFLMYLSSDFELWSRFSRHAQLCAMQFSAEAYANDFKSYLKTNDLI